MNAALKSEDVNTNAPLARAIAAMGSQKRLADKLGVKSQSISEWLKRETPPERCPAIEHATDEAVRCEDLRPDLCWVRGDSDDILGFLTPVDNATPEYVRASLLGWARSNAAPAAHNDACPGPHWNINLEDREIAVSDLLSTCFAHHEEEAKAKALADPRIKSSIDLEFVDLLVEVGKEAIEASAKENMRYGAGYYVADMIPGIEDDAREALANDAGVFELDADGRDWSQSLNALQQTVRTRLERAGYLRGMMHGLPEEKQKELRDHYKIDDMVAQTSSEEEFSTFADMLLDSVDCDRSNYDLAYGHAYGIMHVLDEDQTEQLIEKHAFNDPERTDYVARLDTLYNEVQEILKGQAADATVARAERKRPVDFTEVGCGNIHYSFHGDWIRADAATVSVGDCLDDASLILAEASAVLKDAEDTSDSDSAAARLIGLARHTVALAHKKLIVGGKDSTEARA